MPRKKRFKSLKSAESFAKKVNGKVNDLTNIEGAKSPYSVTYEVTEKTKNHWKRDFSFPESYWRD